MARLRRYRRIHPKGCTCRECDEKQTQKHYNFVRATVGGIIIMAICI